MIERNRRRFTVRGVMAAVAIAALLMAAERLAARRACLLERAELYADRANDFDMGWVCLRDEYNKEGMYDKLRDHWIAMARKYRVAASRPWLTVGPDPPPPTR